MMEGTCMANINISQFQFEQGHSSRIPYSSSPSWSRRSPWRGPPTMKQKCDTCASTDARVVSVGTTTTTITHTHNYNSDIGSNPSGAHVQMGL